MPFNGGGFVEPDEIAAAIKPSTKLVIVNHGSNVLGTVQPIAEIGRICREKEVLFAIDTAQTAGVIPIDMQAMNVDVLTFTGHKSLMGFTGIGGMCFGKHVVLRQTRGGGTGVRSAYPFHLEEYPFRMEYGTPNMLGVASLWAGQEFIESQGGVEVIHAGEMELARRLVAGFREIEDVRIYGCEDMQHHLSTITVNVEGMEAGDVGIMLDVDFDVATRTGLHCAPLVHEQIGTMHVHGGVRFSIGAFNTIHDIDTTVAAMAEITTRVRR